MKMFSCLVLAIAVSAFAACEKKPETVAEKIEDKVNDGLDRRPGEKVRDAGEEVKDAAKDTKDAVKDAVR